MLSGWSMRKKARRELAAALSASNIRTAEQLDALLLRAEGVDVNGLTVRRVGTKNGEILWQVVKTKDA